MDHSIRGGQEHTNHVDMSLLRRAFWERILICSWRHCRRHVQPWNSSAAYVDLHWITLYWSLNWSVDRWVYQSVHQLALDILCLVNLVWCELRVNCTFRSWDLPSSSPASESATAAERNWRRSMDCANGENEQKHPEDHCVFIAPTYATTVSGAYVPQLMPVLRNSSWNFISLFWCISLGVRGKPWLHSVSNWIGFPWNFRWYGSWIVLGPSIPQELCQTHQTARRSDWWGRRERARVSIAPCNRRGFPCPRRIVHVRSKYSNIQLLVPNLEACVDVCSDDMLMHWTFSGQRIAQYLGSFLSSGRLFSAWGKRISSTAPSSEHPAASYWDRIKGSC